MKSIKIVFVYQRYHVLICGGVRWQCNAFNDYRIHIIQYMRCYQLSILTLNSVKYFISLLPIIFISYHYVDSIPINDMHTTVKNMKTNCSYLCSLHAIQILQKSNRCSIERLSDMFNNSKENSFSKLQKPDINLHSYLWSRKNIYNKSGRPHMQCTVSRRSCKAHNWAL